MVLQSAEALRNANQYVFPDMIEFSEGVQLVHFVIYLVFK